MQVAVGGSAEVDQPDAVVAELGLTGIPFTNVYNGCATAGSALALAKRIIGQGEYQIGLVVGMDKARPWVSLHRRPDCLCLSRVVRRDGAVPHDQVLRHEDQPIHA